MKKKILAIIATLTLVASVSAADKMGLDIGLGLGYNTDYLNKGSGTIAPAAGTILTLADTTGFTGTSGSGTSLTGVDISLNLSYSITPYLFARTGFTYGLVLSEEYKYTTATFDYGVKYSGSQMEIPLLLGFNLLKVDKSSVYFAVGIDFNIVSYEIVDSSTQTGADTSVTQTFSGSTIGLLWLTGATYEVSPGLSIFAEVKFLNATPVATDERQVAGTSDANPSAFDASGNTAATKATAATTVPKTLMNAGYTRWSIGVNKSL